MPRLPCPGGPRSVPFDPRGSVLRLDRRDDGSPGTNVAWRSESPTVAHRPPGSRRAETCRTLRRSMLGYNAHPFPPPPPPGGLPNPLAPPWEQPWNPAFEAWPGGPHPGAIAAMQAQQAAVVQQDTQQAHQRSTFLLLLT